jgi:hypothetical protein
MCRLSSSFILLPRLKTTNLVLFAFTSNLQLLLIVQENQNSTNDTAYLCPAFMAIIRTLVRVCEIYRHEVVNMPVNSVRYM